MGAKVNHMIVQFIEVEAHSNSESEWCVSLDLKFQASKSLIFTETPWGRGEYSAVLVPQRRVAGPHGARRRSRRDAKAVTSHTKKCGVSNSHFNIQSTIHQPTPPFSPLTALQLSHLTNTRALWHQSVYMYLSMLSPFSQLSNASKSAQEQVTSELYLLTYCNRE